MDFDRFSKLIIVGSWHNLSCLRIGASSRLDGTNTKVSTLGRERKLDLVPIKKSYCSLMV